MKTVLELCRQAREVSFMLPQCAAQQRTQALLALADMLIEGSVAVMRENKIDIQEACKQKVSDASLERLVLSRERIEEMAEGVRAVAGLPDPLGQIFDERDLPNGLHIRKQRVPLGVLAVIYESRPNVTIDVAALTIKSGNAVILRGGREVVRTNAALVDITHQALKRSMIAETSVQFLDDPERRLVDELLTMHAYVDMLIPRGGADLHTYCRENSHIPVITGGIGICHLFVDESADLQKAIEVIVNAKVQRPTVCNALDTLLIHEKIAPVFLPVLVERMQVEGVVLHLPAELIERYAFTQNDLLVPAKEGDYDREWLSLHMNIDVVPDIGSAISFIHQHSTAHSDGILTEDQGNAALFLSKVDSAVVYVNASTRFTDGAQLGLGAEVAISTQRLHARGPMGLPELMTYKWVVQGDYHVRDK